MSKLSPGNSWTEFWWDNQGIPAKIVELTCNEDVLAGYVALQIILAGHIVPPMICVRELFKMLSFKGTDNARPIDIVSCFSFRTFCGHIRNLALEPRVLKVLTDMQLLSDLHKVDKPLLTHWITHQRY